MSINFLNVFVAKEDDQVCSIAIETRGMEYLFVQKKCFFIDSTETDDKITKHEDFIGHNDVTIPFAYGEKGIF